MKLHIGADPEVFAKKGRTIINADGLVSGTKQKPQQVNCGAVQVDGMALEFNIDPATTSEEFDHNIKAVMSELEKESGAKLVIKPVHNFTKKTMDEASDQAKELGCEPDYNAYTMEQNPAPDVSDSVLFRTAAGHIHLGWWDEPVDPSDPGHMEACATIAKALDGVIGVISVIMEGPNKRRKLYGKAGSFRPKPYGMEYRVPSNWWIEKESYRKGIFEITKMVFEGLQKGRRPFEDEHEYRKIIDGKSKIPTSSYGLVARYHLWGFTHKDQLKEIVPMLNEYFGAKGW